MLKEFKLRLLKKTDTKLLLEWRNDIITRQNSHNAELTSIDEHKKYIDATIDSLCRKQYVIEYNKIPVGTIREDTIKNNDFELSYTVDPSFRNKKIGQMMLRLYLIEKKGSFICKVYTDNIPSIKMIEKLGFKLFKREQNINFYKLAQG